MKLLLVEDEKELNSDICKYLIKEGYLIESAQTYKEGREKLLLFEYDCAIIEKRNWNRPLPNPPLGKGRE